MSNKKVALIIALYDGMRFMPDFVASLKKMTTDGIDLHIIAVDDCSPDDSAEFFKKEFTDAECIRNEKNLGFVGANNVGYQAALRWGAEYVFLLNQDTIVAPDFLQEAVAIFEQTAFDGKPIGAVQSLMVLHPDTKRINSVGNALHFLGFGYCRGYKDLYEKDTLPKIQKISGYASGGAVLLKTEILENAGGLFDPELWMYHEDLELGWRLTLAGYTTVLASRSVVYHKYEFSRSISKFYWMERNRFRVLFTMYHFWTLLGVMPILFAMEPMMLFFALRGGWIKERLRMYGYFLHVRTWRSISRRRTIINKLRSVPDRKILPMMTSKIEFQEQGINSPIVIFGNYILTVFYKLLCYLSF